MIIQNEEQQKPKLKIESLITRIYYGLPFPQKKQFLLELDKFLSKYYTLANMVPPSVSIEQRGIQLKGEIRRQRNGKQ